MADEGVQYVPLSQFNAARQLTGEKPIELAPNEYLVDNTVDKSADYAKALGQKGRTVTVDGHELTASGQVVSQSLQVSNMSCLIAVLVVPDELAADRFAAGDLPSMSELNVNLVGDSLEQAMKDLMAEYGKAVPPSEEHAEMGSTYESGAWPASYYYTSEGVIADSMGLKLLLVYLALYIGFVFLMTTAAVLSVQQLSEIADGIPRYRLLAQLGCDRSMVLRSLRTQIGIYFVAPLRSQAAIRMRDQPSVQEPAIALGRGGCYRHAYHRHRAGSCGICNLLGVDVPGCTIGSDLRRRQEVACVAEHRNDKGRLPANDSHGGRPLLHAQNHVFVQVARLAICLETAYKLRRIRHRRQQPLDFRLVEMVAIAIQPLRILPTQQIIVRRQLGNPQLSTRTDRGFLRLPRQLIAVQESPEAHCHEPTRAHLRDKRAQKLRTPAFQRHMMHEPERYGQVADASGASSDSQRRPPESRAITSRFWKAIRDKGPNSLRSPASTSGSQLSTAQPDSILPGKASAKYRSKRRLPHATSSTRSSSRSAARASMTSSKRTQPCHGDCRVCENDSAFAR